VYKRQTYYSYNLIYSNYNRNDNRENREKDFVT
jgi:hypothetical protein